MNKMIVAYVCDSRYIRFLERSINSVKRYNKNVEIAILSDKKYTVPGAKVYMFKPDSELFKFKYLDRMHDGVYYKLYLPLLPYDKVLYLDCDTICQRPLNELWEMPCDFINATESHSYGKVQAAELHLQKYAITGMMVMNLNALRKENFTEKCLNFLKENWHIKRHDETIINKLFNSRIGFVDKKFNYCRDRIYDDPIAESDAYILHYVGGKTNKLQMLRLDDFGNLYELKRIMKGAKVAIVGNSESILKKNQGKEIDSHDIVIRFNRGYPSDKVGYKTTALFLACTLSEEELKKFNAHYTIKRSNLCKNRCDFNLSTSDRIRYAQLPNDHRKEFYPGKLSQASTGFIAIQFALSTECKSIDLYGFDFFKSPTYYNAPGYQTLHNGDKEGEKVLEYAKYGLLKIN